MCDYLWIGRACQRRACASNCSGMGECDNGICICLDGYGDPSKPSDKEDCSSCLNKCSGHGECDQSTRRCLCSPWFTGEDCSFAICPNGCSAHGSCGLDGKCICDAGWTSYACDEPTCPHDCSGHGLCAHGICICQAGYAGAACSTPPSAPAPSACIGKSGLICSGRGACEMTGTDSGGNGTAACLCDLGWAGAACEWRIPCVGNCSGHGACVLDAASVPRAAENGTCRCDEGWSGADCSSLSTPASASGCPAGLNAPDGSEVPCSGHGACQNGVCVCDPGYAGLECASNLGNATCVGMTAPLIDPMTEGKWLFNHLIQCQARFLGYRLYC
jgi:tenascin